MASIISIDERLIGLLPPKPRLKINRLIALAQDLESSFQSIIGRTNALREDLGRIRDEQRQAVTRAREVSERDETVAAAAAHYTPAIDELEGEIRRNGIEQAKRDQRRIEAAQLVAQLRSFLEQSSMSLQPLAPAPNPPPRLQGDETPPAAVLRIRSEITKAHHEVTTLQRAPLPSAELRAKARDYVGELGKAGTPQVIAERGGFRVDWPPGAQTPMGTMGPGSAAIIAALFPDQLIAVLDAQIDKVTGAGLSSNERPKREAQLRAHIASLERAEESIIELYEGEFDLLRRSHADPCAVLGVRHALAAKVA
jgi:hypothetical protein